MFIIRFVLEISYNKPKLDPQAQWNPEGITFATSTIIGRSPLGIFISRNNTIYVADRTLGRIVVWLNDLLNETKIIADDIVLPKALFVAANGDIFTGNTYPSSRVDRRQLNSNSTTVVMLVDAECYGLFVDRTYNLYCSLRDLNRVVKKPINSVSNMLTVVAGPNCSFPDSNSLDRPYGIFVDINFDLYVADFGNHRIQLFSPDRLNATTVAGSSAVGTIALYYPTGVTLDADNYLFIVDNGNSRIVGSGPNGFRCVAACSGKGSTSNSLKDPLTMAFDSYGNIYVTDQNNNRTQKFVLLNNTYRKSVRFIEVIFLMHICL